MGKDKGLSPNSSTLRCRAEERLSSENIKAPAFLPNEESQRLIHELEVHQIELEMQNSELLKVREELETALDRYSDLSESSPVAFFTLARSGAIVEVNLAGATFLGVGRSLLNGRLFQFFIPEKERKFFDAFLDRVFASGAKVSCEVPLAIEGQAEHFARIEAVVGLSSHDCRAVVIDITERVQAEEALKSSEERLTLALIASNMGVWEWEITTDNIYMSEECIRILGDHGSKQTLASLKNSFHPDDTERVVDALYRAVADKTLYRAEYRVVLPDGEVRWVFGMGRATYDEYGNPLRMFGTVHDITERKRTEQQLEEKQKTITTMAMELSVAEERERCRIAEELHDQVAPKLLLGKMRLHSLAELLPACAGDDALESVMTLIDQSIAEIRSMTFQLRPPILAKAGLEAALKWLCHEYTQNFGLKVKITDDKSYKPLKFEIRSAIFQIVRELLLNVAKHAGTKNAWITSKKTDGMIDIMVEDDGCGADLASFSCKKTTTGGFGICNAKTKIEFFGGAMSIDSSFGSGTRVFIRAPLDTKPEELEKLS